MSESDNSPPPRKTTPHWRKQPLDGKPPRRPSGRHAKKPADGDEAPPRDDTPREGNAIPVHQRLGFRPAEFAALIGVSYPTVWRGIRDGKIDVIDQNGVKIIPRSYAVRAGYITDI